MPTPVPCATPDGRFCKIHERTPVTEMAVKTTPIRNTAPSATAGDRPLPSTRPKAVKAVSEMAQPTAIGSRAQSPISSEPKAAVRHTATNTALTSKPAWPSMPGTTNTEYTMARKVVMPATTSRRCVLPRAEIWKYWSILLAGTGVGRSRRSAGRRWGWDMALLLCIVGRRFGRTGVVGVSRRCR